MTVTHASFIQTFPEFTDTSVYPTATFDVWNLFAVNLVDAIKWGPVTDMGVSFVIAHNMVLSARAAASAAAGGVPGLASGIISSKSIDKVSVGLDVITASEKDAGLWNLTDYGQRYWQMAMMFGAGGAQL